MAFSYTGGAVNSAASGTSVTITHGLTINEGDPVVFSFNMNNTGTITPSETWDGSDIYAPGTETATLAVYWKIAGASEPATYTFTLGTSSEWSAGIKVFTSATDAQVDSAFANAIATADATYLDCTAINGATLGDNCLSIIVGGKDNRNPAGGGEIYDTADNSYVSAIGKTIHQDHGMAHRIYGASPSAPSSVRIDTTDLNDGDNDKTYSTHISFVEGTTGGITVPLTGVSASGQIGALTPIGHAIVSLSGVQANGQVGTITVQTATGAVVPLTGVSSSGQVGTLDILGGATIPLSGVQANGQVGTLDILGGAQIQIVGVSASGQVGTISIVTEGGVSVALAGVSSSGQVGSLDIAGGALISLIGAEANGQIGTLSVSVDTVIQLSGVQANGFVGVIDITGHAQVSITGVLANGQVGTININTGITEIEIPGYRVFKVLKEDKTYLVVKEDKTYLVNE